MAVAEAVRRRRAATALVCLLAETVPSPLPPAHYHRRILATAPSPARQSPRRPETPAALAAAAADAGASAVVATATVAPSRRVRVLLWLLLLCFALLSHGVHAARVRELVSSALHIYAVLPPRRLTAAPITV